MVILKSCFRRPAFTVIGGLVLFFITIGLSLFVSVASLNEVETSEMNLFVTMPQGSTLASTDLRTKKVEEMVMEIPVVEKVISQISEGEAVLSVQLIEGFDDLDSISVPDVKNKLQSISEEFEDLDISLDPPQRLGSQGGGAPSPSDDFERMLGIGSASERIIIKGKILN